MSALIELAGFSKNFGSTKVLQDIDLKVREGEVVVILGPSGCGKSTLLRCLNGLELGHAGTYRFAGRELPANTDWRPVRQQIGMVFQSYHLFPHMSVLDNILLGPLSVQKRPLQQARAQAETLLGAGRPAGQTRCLPPRVVRRPAATHRHRSCPVHEPQGHAVRRGHRSP
jgi:polar amino acid transport system ATP-binding protein